MKAKALVRALDTISDFRNLDVGWDGWSGAVPTEKARRAAYSALTAMHLYPPAIYPTPDGSVRLEWEGCKIKFGPDGLQCSYVQSESKLTARATRDKITLTFGPHKGRTVDAVAADDPGYLRELLLWNDPHINSDFRANIREALAVVSSPRGPVANLPTDCRGTALPTPTSGV